MSYLRYLCLFTYSVVYHILCFVFVLLVFVFMYPMLSVSLDCPSFLLSLPYSLAFNYDKISTSSKIQQITHMCRHKDTIEQSEISLS